MKTPKAPKLSRSQLREALDTIPASQLLGREVNRNLTSKQRKFALELAKGNTKAGAYRAAYNVTSKSTMSSEPYRLAEDPKVSREVQAMEAAMRAMEYQTPAALRALVIQSLVKVITDPDSKPGQVTAAAKVLGTVTEVAAFTERKEVRTISSSEDARARIMAELTQLVKGQAQDVQAIDVAADSLLAELSQGADPTTPAPPNEENGTPAGQLHTIPHEQFPISPDLDPTPFSQEDPPLMVPKGE